MGDLREFVLSWLATQGHPLELRVGHLLRQHNWQVDHAVWYSDPETGKSRELDVVATIGAWRGNAGINCRFAVECKQSEKPWVVFSAEKQPSLRRADPLIANDVGQAILTTSIRKNIEFPFELYPGDRLGHGIVKVGSEKSGDPTSAFAALRGAISGATSIGTFADSFTRRLGNRLLRAVEFVIPLIVFEGVLFEYYLNSTGTAELREIDAIAVSTPAPNSTEPQVVVVLRSTSLDRWLSGVSPLVHGFCVAMLPYVDDVLAEVVRTSGTWKRADTGSNG
jgi:hypothetical protein